MDLCVLLDTIGNDFTVLGVRCLTNRMQQQVDSIYKECSVVGM
jgi:hypothetical protein